MKKIVIIVLVSMLFSLIQARKKRTYRFEKIYDYEQRSNFGIQTGLSFANVLGKDFERIEQADRKVGFFAGFIYSHPVLEKLALQHEINYIMKGFKSTYKASPSAPKNESACFLDYLEYGLLTKISINKNMVNPKPFIYLGFSGAYNTKAQLVEYPNVGEAYKIVYSLKDYIKDYDFTFIGGIRLENGKYTADVRYSQSLIDVIYDDFVYDDELYNYSVRLIIGLKFGAKARKD